MKLHLFERISSWISHQFGTPKAFIFACVLIIIWVICGPFFNYSDTWQLIINTATTILTFLAVFLIQNTQNRDNAAIHVKLDELLRSSPARNELIGIEKKSSDEIFR